MGSVVDLVVAALRRCGAVDSRYGVSVWAVYRCIGESVALGELGDCLEQLSVAGVVAFAVVWSGRDTLLPWRGRVWWLVG